MRYKLLYLIAIISLCFAMATPVKAQVLSEDATISLLSCSPGYPLYYHYGHSAIRVQDPDYTVPDGTHTSIDWTFNYGVFDFRVDGFYLKFVKGETDYELAIEYTSDFQLSSSWEGRTVYFQPLVLIQEQKQAIFDALLENYRPENRYYRYNFVYDNCATRPWNILKRELELPDPEGMSGWTWREATDRFSGKWTWAKFGINVLFGYEADREMTVEESLFLPENLMNYVSQQGMTEDEYIAPFTPRDGNFWTSPELALLIIFLILIGVTALDVWRKKQTWAVDVILFFVYLMLGIVVFALYFWSTHPFVGSNLNILYLNPLWLAPLVMCFFEKGRAWIIKASPVLLGWLVIALIWIMLRHQSLHLMLTLVFLHTCRLAFIRKQQ